MFLFPKSNTENLFTKMKNTTDKSPNTQNKIIMKQRRNSKQQIKPYECHIIIIKVLKIEINPTWKQRKKIVNHKPSSNFRRIRKTKQEINKKEMNKPESVNSEKNSRIKPSMRNNFRFTHLQSRRHPVQESEISANVEINIFPNKISGTTRTISSPIEIPFRKINSVVDGLNSQNGKSKKEDKGSQDID